MISARLTDRPAHWLLDLTIAGRVYRVADVDLQIETAAGGVVEYAAGLPDLTLTVGFDGISATAIELGPWQSDAWAELVALGADLSAASALLRRWYEGTVIELADSYAQGLILDPAYETADDPIAFSIDLPRYDRTQTVPSRTQRVDPTTWPITAGLVPDPSMLGATYPRIYGRPGRAGSFLWGSIEMVAAATPAYMAEISRSALTYTQSKLVIAGHFVEAAEVTLIKTSAGFERGEQNYAQYLVQSGADLRGQPISYIQLSDDQGPNYDIVWDMGATWAISWAEGGGVVDPESGTALRRLGQVVIDLMVAGGVPVARGRAEAARAQLDRYLVDVAICEPVRAEDWILEQIGGLIPLIRRETPEGVWFEAMPYDATADDGIADLVGDTPDDASVDGYIVEQTSPFVFGDARIVENDLILRYLRSNGEYLRTIRIRGDEVDAADAANAEYGSLLAVLSRQRYGERQVEVTSDWIADDATAVLAAQARLARSALSRRSLSVRGGPELAWLQPNDVIRYTRSACGLAQMPAIITSVTAGLLEVELSIELLERPSQRGRV